MDSEIEKMCFSALFQFSQEILNGNSDEGLSSLLKEVLTKKEQYQKASNFLLQLKNFLYENLPIFNDELLPLIVSFAEEFGFTFIEE